MDAQYTAFKHHIQAQPPMHPTSHPIPHQHDIEAEEDLDMDAQLENVSPERGGSSLQVSLERHSIQAAQEPSQKSIRIAESTPQTLQYRNPRIVDASESQTTKRRKAEDYTATSTLPSKTTPTPSSARSKRVATLGIDMIGQMWLGFQMHEALSIQHGKKELSEKRTDEEFNTIGTPDSEIQEFRSL